MSEQELNSYRFTSQHEPTDEMLAQIMKEVTRDARLRSEEATSVYFSNMRKEALAVKARWADRINKAING
ncbi:MAG: hypothetical protein K2K08_07775 [Paramuribaculum sp.]|nr:hypothetical protein [Paramuribaculum sp.]